MPSVYEMTLVYEAFVNNELNNKLTAVGGSSLGNERYWTLTEMDGNANTQAVTINPQTGARATAHKSSGNFFRTRYFFAF